MSEDQNQHSEDGSFKEQIMRALEEGRKNREVEPTKKTTASSGRLDKENKSENDEELASSYERLFGKRQTKNEKPKIETVKKESIGHSTPIEEKTAIPPVIKQVAKTEANKESVEEKIDP